MKKRKRYGNGAVYQRGGTWWIRYSVKGKDRRLSVAKELGRRDVTREDAETLLRAKVGAVRAGRVLPVDQERVTVRDVLADYLLHSRNVERKSLKSLTSAARAVGEGLADERIVALQPATIDATCTAWREAGKAIGTVWLRIAVLKAALTLAHRRGTIAAVPYVPDVPRGSRRRGFFTPPEIATMIAALPDPLDDILRFSYATGWRREEVLGLRWSMIDRVVGEIRLPTSKNGEGRTIPMLPSMSDLIEKRWMLRAKASDFVFHRRGRQVRRFEGPWLKATKAAGFAPVIRTRKDGETYEAPGRVLHDLRRSAVRDLIRSGVPRRVAMLISGHRSESTFSWYDIEETREVKDALAAMEAYRETLRAAAEHAQKQHTQDAAVSGNPVSDQA